MTVATKLKTPRICLPLTLLDLYILRLWAEYDAGPNAREKFIRDFVSLDPEVSKTPDETIIDDLVLLGFPILLDEKGEVAEWDLFLESIDISIRNLCDYDIIRHKYESLTGYLSFEIIDSEVLDFVKDWESWSYEVSRSRHSGLKHKEIY